MENIQIKNVKNRQLKYIKKDNDHQDWKKNHYSAGEEASEKMEMDKQSERFF